MPSENMTLEQAIYELYGVKNSQATFKADEAVKYAITILEALQGRSN
jgi:hypothetical protein